MNPKLNEEEPQEDYQEILLRKIAVLQSYAQAMQKTNDALIGVCERTISALGNATKSKKDVREQLKEDFKKAKNT